jgi:hypothetical protein
MNDVRLDIGLGNIEAACDDGPFLRRDASVSENAEVNGSIKTGLYKSSSARQQYRTINT